MTTVYVIIRERDDLVTLSEQLRGLTDDWDVRAFDLWKASDNEWTLDATIVFEADNGREGMMAVTSDLAGFITEGWNILSIDSSSVYAEKDEPEKVEKDEGDGRPALDLQKLIQPHAVLNEPQHNIDLSSRPLQVTIPGVGVGIVSDNIDDFKNLLRDQ